MNTRKKWTADETRRRWYHAWQIARLGEEGLWPVPGGLDRRAANILGDRGEFDDRGQP